MGPVGFRSVKMKLKLLKMELKLQFSEIETLLDPSGIIERDTEDLNAVALAEAVLQIPVGSVDSDTAAGLMLPWMAVQRCHQEFSDGEVLATRDREMLVQVA